MTKSETIRITRHGFDILHAEGIDAAAKVSYLVYTPGQTYDPRTAVKSEWLAPLRDYGMYR